MTGIVGAHLLLLEQDRGSARDLAPLNADGGLSRH